MTQTITALFDSEAQAERAAHDLAKQMGGVRGRIYNAANQDFASEGIPAQYNDVYREGIRRGGAILCATMPEDQIETAAQIMTQDGAVDLQERSSMWRQDGWTGSYTAETRGSATGYEQSQPQRAGEERIPIVEEQVSVGKREVSGGGSVRVHTHVVERPVEEQVRLRDEHVEIERRPVDRPVRAGDDAFQDRTIEARERREEAVVNKEARVTEEVVVRKEGGERTETVRDTERRTEVDIDDQRKERGTRRDR